MTTYTVTTNNIPYTVSSTNTTPYTLSWPSSSTISTSPLTGSNGYTMQTNAYPATHSTLLVKGNAEIEGDLKIKGQSIKDALDKIEERLGILRPNEELEEKWDQLRGLRKMYMELEQEIIEKEKMWAILKK